MCLAVMLRPRGIKRWCASDVCLSYVSLSVATSGLSREQRGLGRLKLAQRYIAHITRDSDTTFKVKRSKVNLQGVGEYCGGLPHSLLTWPRKMCYPTQNNIYLLFINFVVALLQVYLCNFVTYLYEPFMQPTVGIRRRGKALKCGNEKFSYVLLAFSHMRSYSKISTMPRPWPRRFGLVSHHWC